jgi:hypothetical protein
MAEKKRESTSRQGDFKDILDQASKETVHRDQVRAAIPTTVPGVTRKRSVAGAFAVAIPVLAILLAVNVFNVSLMELITPAPSPEVARRQAQEALDSVVKGIETFRKDYEELPERLIEVASPEQGQWTYTRKSGGHYQVRLALHGQVLNFDSAQSAKVNDEKR